MNENLEFSKTSRIDLESVCIVIRSVPGSEGEPGGGYICPKLVTRVLENLKFSFIFVHSVHSMNLEHSRTFLKVVSRRHEPYQPPPTIISTQSTRLLLPTYCPQSGNKISDTLVTNLGQMYPPPGSPSEHRRKPKLCRDTSNKDTNRFQVTSGRFREF